jgi:hypothetical protein
VEVFLAMKLPISKAALLGILFGLLVLGVIIYQTLGLRQYQCEVCVEMNGQTKCVAVKGESEQQALQTAKDSACSFVSNGRDENIRCTEKPPVSVKCKHL